MNERIKELVNRAGGFVSLSYEHDSKLILSGADNIEKFAELIVKECAQVAEEVDGDTRARTCVLEHFGVEE
jgi:hypothetical protein